jgi:hypothetical protein
LKITALIILAITVTICMPDSAAAPSPVPEDYGYDSDDLLNRQRSNGSGLFDLIWGLFKFGILFFIVTFPVVYLWNKYDLFKWKRDRERAARQRERHKEQNPRDSKGRFIGKPRGD